MLDVYPQRAILCSREGEEWEQLAVFKESMRPVMEDLISHSWGGGMKERAAYFAPLLKHEEETLRRLAHLEVARAPYPQIRKIEHAVSKQELLQFLANQRMVEWHALYILLLAQMADEADGEKIAQRCAILADYHLTTQLSAWLLCYLETNKEQAISNIKEWYFSEEARSPQEVGAVMQALSTFGETEYRGDVIVFYSDLLQSHPEVLESVLLDVERWSVRELDDDLKKLVENDVSLRIDLKQRVKKHLNSGVVSEPDARVEQFQYWWLLVPTSVLLVLTVSRCKRPA
ncbi:hypothetical protein ACFSW8_09030 [Rubritalea tangerina]|uniref:Uncharacterized protein n=2 Tax=Rubritalea tangerina TaxID=430798 RepID=A0ABW4ZBD8_9BACT